MEQTLLEIHDLSVSFRMYDRGFEQTDLQVIAGLSLTVYPGEIVAVAGSSGAGKSLLASAILGILPSNAAVKGQLLYKGRELTPALQKQLRGTEIALVPQSVEFLDPLMKVGAQAEGHSRTAGSADKRRELFRRFGLPDGTEKMYPFQLSGGMARRVLVSAALMTDAELIIADEPTPGMSLDQALEALKMFRELADEGKAVILITHDIDLAASFADRVAVFYEGTTVETVSASDFKAGTLSHPYSKALWRALPQNGFEYERK
ncbi:MAG: ABC transporter ATP-binding protein [Oscillospiraceae bacterium]|nr:ABC transporter ATP-binding protein [Oscillospiraceae bacterium]